MGMSNWLVGTIGVVIAGLLLLAFFKLNTQAQERSRSATQQRAARTSEMSLLSMIEIDFQNIASNYPDYDLEPDSAILELSDGVFRYLGQTEAEAEPVEVAYTWTETGTLRTKTGNVPTYQIERYVDGALAGMSSGAVTSFEITLLDSDGNDVGTSYPLARQVNVRISMASSLGESTHLGQSQYEFVVRPYALARNDFEKYTE